MADTHRDEIARLEALYASNPAGRVFTHLAEAYRKAGEPERARDILAAGLERHPDHASAHVVLGRVQQDLGEREEAARSFRRVLELDRHNLVALRSLGDLAVEAGRFEEARHYFGELIQVDPGDFEAGARLRELPEGQEEFLAAEPEGLPSIAAVGGELTEPEAEAELGLPEAEAAAAMEAHPVETPPQAGGVLGLMSVETLFQAGWGREGLDRGEGPAVPEPGAAEAVAEEAVAPGDAAPVGPPAVSPLDAWVVSLDVLEPEPVLPEYPEPLAGLVDTAVPGWEAGGAGIEPGSELPGIEPEAEALVAEPEPRFAEPEPLFAEPEPVFAEPEPLFAEPEAGVAGGTEWIPGNGFPPAAAGAGVESEMPVSFAGPAGAGPEAGSDGRMSEAELESAWWGDPEIHGTVPDPVEWVSQEDWERIAAYGAWSGAADVEETVEAVPELRAEWGESGPDEDADEVATETLAEVYAAQGFRAEAAEIYRKLLRRRPDDPRLLARLLALESEPAAAPEDVGYEAAEAGEAWLERVPMGLPTAEDLAGPGAGPTPYAWVESDAAPEAEEAETIGQRLRDLLGWRPESAAEPVPTLLLEEVAVEPPMPEVPRPAVVTAPPAPVETGDDDLEMFRSWLRSLRK
jgi:tetratricopeptide (TPR) repeat protein